MNADGWNMSKILPPIESWHTFIVDSHDFLLFLMSESFRTSRNQKTVGSKKTRTWSKSYRGHVVILAEFLKGISRDPHTTPIPFPIQNPLKYGNGMSSAYGKGVPGAWGSLEKSQSLGGSYEVNYPKFPSNLNCPPDISFSFRIVSEAYWPCVWP